MNRIVPILGCVWLLNACAASINPFSQAINHAANCPNPTTIAVATPGAKESFYQQFDHHARQILVDDHTLKFQTLKHDFVFCRRDSTWTVQPGTLAPEFYPPQNYIETAREMISPAYKAIDLLEATYQYRVISEPQFFVGEGGVLTRSNVAPENDKVIFELISPKNQAPQRQVIYTLKDLQQAATASGYSSEGVKLGFPRITASIAYGDRLFWSLSFEQGEGNTGLGTIVSYDPQTENFTLIQPQELRWQQITDLAVTGDPNNPTLWLGTNISGEGNSYLPAMGLVAYHLDWQKPNSGSITAYSVHNSPLVGAIPDRLKLVDDTLWVSTGNGTCQVKWQAAADPESWQCWRFALMSQLPAAGVPLYEGVMETTPALTLTPPTSDQTVEVLWRSPLDYQTRQSRYEVRNPEGFTVELDTGVKPDESARFLPPGKPPLDWVGSEWHWQGDRFVRGLDQVASNNFGGGPQGIGVAQSEPNRPPNWYAMRGDLELLQLTPQSTTVKYYSGWVDENLLAPVLSVVPQTRPQNPQPNPLLAKVNDN